MSSLAERAARTAVTGYIIFSGVAGAACEQAPFSRSIGNRGAAQEQIQKDPAKEYVLSVINSLPESPIKNNLQTTVAPLFRTPAPQVVNIAGVDVPVYNVEATFPTTNISGFKGYSSVFREEAGMPEVTVKRDTLLMLPYIELAKPEEMSLFERGRDGTPLIRVPIAKGAIFTEGINPRIEVVSPIHRQREIWEIWERSKAFITLKEITTLFLYIARAEEQILTMRQLGLPADTEVAVQNQSVKSMNLIIPIDRVIESKGGRMPAALDIAGYALAIKAYHGTDTQKLLATQYPRYAAVMPSLEATDFGTTPGEMYRRSHRWVLTTAEAQGLPHSPSFNLSQIP